MKTRITNFNQLQLNQTYSEIDADTQEISKWTVTDISFCTATFSDPDNINKPVTMSDSGFNNYVNDSDFTSFFNITPDISLDEELFNL